MKRTIHIKRQGQQICGIDPLPQNHFNISIGEWIENKDSDEGAFELDSDSPCDACVIEAERLWKEFSSYEAISIPRR